MLPISWEMLFEDIRDIVVITMCFVVTLGFALFLLYLAFLPFQPAWETDPAALATECEKRTSLSVHGDVDPCVAYWARKAAERR